MAYVFLLAFAIVIGLLLLEKLKHAETRLLVLTVKWTVAGVLLLMGIYLTLVGRLFHVALIGVLFVMLCQQDVRRWVKRKPLSLPPPLGKKKKKKTDE